MSVITTQWVPGKYRLDYGNCHRFLKYVIFRGMAGRPTQYTRWGRALNELLQATDDTITVLPCDIETKNGITRLVSLVSHGIGRTYFGYATEKPSESYTLLTRMDCHLYFELVPEEKERVSDGAIYAAASRHWASTRGDEHPSWDVTGGDSEDDDDFPWTQKLTDEAKDHLTRRVKPGETEYKPFGNVKVTGHTELVKPEPSTTVADMIKDMRAGIETVLQEKTSWGRNDLKARLDSLLIDVLVKYVK